MKKIYILIISLMFIPVSAQVVDLQTQTKDELILALTQVIQLLIQQVTDLQTRLGLALEGTPINEGVTTIQPIQAPIIAQSSKENSVCTGLPTITVKPESRGTIEGDIITQPYYDGYNYIDFILSDSCVELDDLLFSYDTPRASTSGNWKNIGKNGMAFAISGTTTTQTLKLTASEPNGGTVTRIITVNTQ